MNCQQFIERLDEYLDGELTHPDHPSAISHAQSCSSCQWRLTQRQALRAALRELPVPSARPGFLDDALHQARRSYPRWRRSYVVGAA
ncbi:MAG TPA: zf-HC2 domain-containing protein, partial [Burkholderiales bacterium]|nr:zf-HC2 domain-containing protein [Burkholderiales bacterium]